MVSNTHNKGERVKIPLLPNRVGKRSGTMTMVTTNKMLLNEELTIKRLVLVTQYSLLWSNRVFIVLEIQLKFRVGQFLFVSAMRRT